MEQHSKCYISKRLFHKGKETSGDLKSGDFCSFFDTPIINPPTRPQKSDPHPKKKQQIFAGN